MTVPVVAARVSGTSGSTFKHVITMPGGPILISPHNMTSNTAPSPFVASASSVPGYGTGTTYAPMNAFDGLLDIGHYWIGIGGGVDWLQLDRGVGSAQILQSYDIQANTIPEPLRSPKNWTMKGSNDGITFTVVDTRTNETSWGSGELRSYTCATQTTAYRYFRLDITANNGDATNTVVGELSLWMAGAGTPAGDLLVVVFTKSRSGAPVIDLTASGGKWWQGPTTNVGGFFAQTIFAKIAEGGDALTLYSTDQAGGNVSSHISFRITGHGSAVTIGAAAVSGSGNADPPSATQSGSAQDTLVIAAYSGGHVATAAPSGYSNLTTQTTVATTAETSTAEIGLTAINTENPGTFTNTSDFWIANTILVASTAITTKARVTQVAIEVLSSTAAAPASTGQAIVFTST
jgi:hypothetical protein